MFSRTIWNWCLYCSYLRCYLSNEVAYFFVVREPNLLFSRGQLLVYQGIKIGGFDEIRTHTSFDTTTSRWRGCHYSTNPKLAPLLRIALSSMPWEGIDLLLIYRGINSRSAGVAPTSSDLESEAHRYEYQDRIENRSLSSGATNLICTFSLASDVLCNVFLNDIRDIRTLQFEKMSEKDSNLQSFRPWLLRPWCIPVPTLMHYSTFLTNTRLTTNENIYKKACSWDLPAVLWLAFQRTKTLLRAIRFLYHTLPGMPIAVWPLLELLLNHAAKWKLVAALGNAPSGPFD